ncbi:hypothetical protein PR202_ga16763 [Eleusine coracana subsp. coracana]|uniref:Wall-associated receptor kinase galacturonan-binding domain-containing protein n=1 Tax=Eleusine coracana subsp. coracana TaxID=191504 RepID=A0AAV5CNF6_ELECO|nr:hypothetical protein QOZ80_6AG0524700 [Eleusine coracana subsp. coracana]GJM99642.1 hypothetical protein PR202_ga16763 [Eleusine coracana subsp. coracana]
MEEIRHHHVSVLAAILAALVVIAASPWPATAGICRDSCGGIPVRYPLGIDDGCGSPYYRNMLACASDNATLRLRTPSGTYPVAGADYSDPHLVVRDPSMWTCDRPFTNLHAAPFSLDTSTRFSLSPRNEYLFFDCDEDHVIVAPRPASCDAYPDRRLLCDSACDSAGYLCRNLPGCQQGGASAVGEDDQGGSNNMSSCCAYRPRAAESLRMMLQHCEAYTSVYWRAVGDKFPPYDQVAEYGVRVDFEIPVTTRCLQCQDKRNGDGGTCGFDPATRDFLCICQDGRNSTTDCAGGHGSKNSAGVIAASVVFSVSAAIGVGGLVWYIRKIRSNKVVTCGVQSNENRFF